MFGSVCMSSHKAILIAELNEKFFVQFFFLEAAAQFSHFSPLHKKNE